MCRQIRARSRRCFNQILVNPEKLGKGLERRAQFAEPGRARRFFVIIVKLAVLGATEPGDVERAQVAGASSERIGTNDESVSLSSSIQSPSPPSLSDRKSRITCFPAARAESVSPVQ